MSANESAAAAPHRRHLTLLNAGRPAAPGYPADLPHGDPAEVPRRERTRARTQSIKRLSKRDLERGTALYPPSINADAVRPRTYEDCVALGLGADDPRTGEARPCPFVSCKHHLYLDVNPRTGSIKFNFPDQEIDELAETCALRVADRGGITLEEVGEILNLTRERIRQLETRSIAALKCVHDRVLEDLADDAGAPPPGPRY